MKEKLKSRKFWIVLFANIISITIIFSNILSSISYMISESMVDMPNVLK